MTATLGSSFHVGPDDQPDKYRLLQQVGRGGEAQLWQGELSVAGGVEPVAIKIRSRTEGDFARSSQRWNEQAELLRFIRHPGVVGVREHFEGAHFHLRGQVHEAPERALYLVMNWVDGMPLHEWALLHRDAPDRLPRVVRHLEQVADVLDWLHSGEATPSRRPVIHGDLSAGNVMILPTGQAMLVDFGLVRVVSHRTERAAGTPGYAAPEVWHSGDYSPASDRYAFGAVAWFALTGEAPPPIPEMLRTRLLALPIAANLPPDAAAQLGSIFSEHPQQRPQSLLDWTRLLRRGVLTSTAQRAVNGHPAHNGAPSTFVPPPRPVAPTTEQRPVAEAWPAAPVPTTPRRRRRIGLAAAALVAAVIGGMVLGNSLFGEDTPTGSTTAPSASAPVGPAPRPLPPSDDATEPDGDATGGTVAPLPPTEFRVRASTGDVPIRLTQNYGVDLDSQASDWELDRGSGHDLNFISDYVGASDGADLAPVAGAPDVRTCQGPVAYGARIVLDSVDVPAHYCVRTSEGRYAALTVLDVTGPVILDVTVWDPPRPS